MEIKQAQYIGKEKEFGIVTLYFSAPKRLAKGICPKGKVTIKARFPEESPEHMITEISTQKGKWCKFCTSWEEKAVLIQEANKKLARRGGKLIKIPILEEKIGGSEK